MMDTNKLLYLTPMLIWLTFLGLSGCLDDSISTDSSLRIEISTDTLLFDTVFTTIGSTTKSFRIINPNTENLSIKRLKLANQAGASYRLNVDGIAGTDFSDIRIAGRDSIWVFVELTVDPNQPLSISPFVIENAIEFEVNDNNYSVIIQAWGQNANYITPASSKGKVALLSCDLGTELWDDPKPYVLFGVLVIDECSLVLAPGTKIYVHGGIVKEKVNEEINIRNDGVLFVGPRGQIIARGTRDNPIVIQGDRLEREYQELAGQWAGIILGANSRGNVFEHTTIKNSIIGMLADSSASVRMDACQIYNTAGSGLVGRSAEIRMDNSLVYNNGVNSVKLVLGGKYHFRHCSFANYQNTEEALVAANFVRLNDEAMTPVIKPLEMRFDNCVIAGNDNDELVFADITQGQEGYFDYHFSHCALQVDELLNIELYSDFLSANCTECIQIKADVNFPPVRIFRSINRLDYRPDSLSILEDAALYDPDLPVDLDGVMRFEGKTDIGCYEFVPQG